MALGGTVESVAVSGDDPEKLTAYLSELAPSAGPVKREDAKFDQIWWPKA